MYVERQAHLCDAAKENSGDWLEERHREEWDGIEVLHSFIQRKDVASADDS